MIDPPAGVAFDRPAVPPISAHLVDDLIDRPIVVGAGRVDREEERLEEGALIGCRVRQPAKEAGQRAEVWVHHRECALEHKLERRITISATVSEAVAEAFHNAKNLPKEVHRVAQRDIAGARYVPPSDARVVEYLRLAT